MILRYTIIPSVKGTGKNKFIDAYTTQCHELMTIDGLRKFASELWRDHDYTDASWYDARRKDCIKAKQKTYWADVYSDRGYFLDAIPQETRKKYLTYKLRQDLDAGKPITFYAIEY